MDSFIHPDWSLVLSLGGPTKVATLLKTTPQRVHNWKQRGIPPRMKLKRPDLFLPQPIRRPQKASA